MGITKILISTILVFAFTGCGDITGTDTGANNKTDNPDVSTVGDLSFTKVSEGKIRLDGTMENGGDSGANFEIQLQLKDDKKGTFIFFADKELNQGVKLTAEKIDGAAQLTLTINDVSHSFTRPLGKDGTLSLSMDIHNDHEDAHIIVWNLAGPFGDSDNCLEDDSCIYNTEYYTQPNPGPWGAQGKGPGAFWGFEGDKEIIIKLSKPKDALSDA